MLTDILPARYRKAAYGLYALVGVVLGAVQVAYLNIAGQPTWLTVALAVFGFVGTALGATAASNITTAPTGLTTEQEARLADLFDQRAAAAAAQVARMATQPVYAAPKKKAAKKAAPKPPAAG